MSKKIDNSNNILEKFTKIVPYTPYICSSILGYYSYDLLKPYIHVGQTGVDYYAEAHLSSWNARIHTMGMPFTIFGILQWIPTLLGLNYNQSKMLAYNLYTLYAGHYFRIDKRVFLMYLMFYYLPLKYAINEYKIHNPSTLRWWLFKKGFITSFLALGIQEGVGHYIGGDIASRPEGVLNAIVYAMYFSVGHWF
ncbi:MAG: hypothetical protein CML42_05620 [Rhodobacteraceae bacterium]|nr:hypothetical protein [Paracoccaceae bacterium]|tara:strand:- start:3837 stop:4418 length:582 start_codon:yes stop_codon:yes gene_type:complete